MKLHVPVIAMLALCGAASAGDVKGSVTTTPTAPTEADKRPAVVVWIESVPEYTVPKEKPQLSQKDAQFAPRTLFVVAGQTVDMPNDDKIAHNVFSMSPTKQFNLGVYPKGESKEVTFEKAGVVDIFCSLHRHMSAQIVVVPNPHFAVWGADGSFHLKDAPEGTFTVSAWAQGYAKASQTVEISKDGEVSVDFSLTLLKEGEEPKPPFDNDKSIASAE